MTWPDWIRPDVSIGTLVSILLFLAGQWAISKRDDRNRERRLIMLEQKFAVMSEKYNHLHECMEEVKRSSESASDRLSDIYNWIVANMERRALRP